MYFDDCERRPLVEEWEGWLPELNSRVSWTTSRTEAKQQAIQQLLGYNAQSASKLSTDQVELETLQWLADCNIVWSPDDDDEDDNNNNGPKRTGEPIKKQPRTTRYSTISDLIVASDCHSDIDSLALLWNLIAKLLENQELNSVYMTVFPNATSLWDYDTMVTTLQAIAISKPLLPTAMQNVQLDLFHPDYKHSPRMWSPEMHSPFPTLGLSIQSQPQSQTLRSFKDPVMSPLDVDDELEITRNRLESLFASIDADEGFSARLKEENIDPRQILNECIEWEIDKRIGMTTSNCVVDTHVEPYQIYARLWSVIQQLHAVGIKSMHKDKSLVSSKPMMMLVTPNLDAYTTKRLAITVNVALQQLQSSIRVSDIFFPTESIDDRRYAPHAMIQLTFDNSNSR